MQVLVTSRALPYQPFLQCLGTFPCEYTWTLRGGAFVYVKDARQAPAGVLAHFCKDAGGNAWLPHCGSVPVMHGYDQAVTVQFTAVPPAVRPVVQ